MLFGEIDNLSKMYTDNSVLQIEKGSAHLPITLQTQKSKMVCKNLPWHLIALLQKCYQTPRVCHWGMFLFKNKTRLPLALFRQQVKLTSKHPSSRREAQPLRMYTVCCQFLFCSWLNLSSCGSGQAHPIAAAAAKTLCIF